MLGKADGVHKPKPCVSGVLQIPGTGPTKYRHCHNVSLSGSSPWNCGFHTNMVMDFRAQQLVSYTPHQQEIGKVHF